MQGLVIHRHRKGFISWAIRNITGSWSSHTGVVIDLYGVYFVLEADKGEVRLTKLNEWISNCRYVLQDFNLTTKQVEHLTILGIKQCGKKYDYKNTVLQQLWKKITGKWTGHSKGFATSKFNCSELTAWLLSEVGIKFDNWEQITPKEILDDKRGKII